MGGSPQIGARRMSPQPEGHNLVVLTIDTVQH